MLKDQPIKAKQALYYSMSKSKLLTDKAKAHFNQPPFHTRFLSHYDNPFDGRDQKLDEDEEGMTVDEVVEFFKGENK